MSVDPAFHRTELLVGSEVMHAFARTRVILFGVGGVGGWAAEALVRSGIGHVTLVDPDLVSITNVNRQIQAVPATVGQVKVEALRERLLAIHPGADVAAVRKAYSAQTRGEFKLEEYDYVLDAIDTLSCKLELIASALAAATRLFASMGAARRMDATAVRVGSLWKTMHCPLARHVRQGLRARGITKDFLCVYGAEPALRPPAVVPPCTNAAEVHPGGCRGAEEDPSDGPRAPEARINGSAVHVTGAFGFALAGLVLQNIAGLLRAEG